MNINERIKAWLEAEGLTYFDAATRIGCQPSTIHAWVNGTQPKGLYLKMMTRILNAHDKAVSSG